MPEPQQQSPEIGGVALPLDLLLAELSEAGFPRARMGVGLRLRLAGLLNRLPQSAEPEQFKYRIAALICQSAEEQEKFYGIFDDFSERYRFVEQSTSPAPPPPPPELPPPPSPPSDAEKPAAPLPLEKPPVGQQRTDHATAARPGPITIELHFRDDGYRPWSLPELEAVVRPLREKEWSTAEDWDIPASISRIIRAGGAPHFVRRRRRKAPQYLFLIEQKSVRDHLAGLYADLVTELQRRDVDAEYYFYDHIPIRCWKDRRDASSYTSIDRLHATHLSARLILIGEPGGLLARPNLYPSPLAFQLRDDWPAIALLDTRSTAAWDGAEEALHQLFPVAPATIGGLGSLILQWDNHRSLRPYFWKLQNPEPLPPDLHHPEEEPELVQKTIKNLKVYLGRYGFNWLCAIAVYPELYWSLTKLLHDEAISNADVPEESLRTQLWQLNLLRVSRLEWLRRGILPAVYRKELRQMLPPANAAEVRRQLLEVLEDNKAPENSYAEKDRAYTIALLNHEQTLAKEQPDGEQRVVLDAAFLQRVESEGVALSDVEDAVGRDFLGNLFKTVPSSQLQVLWVDDQPEKNAKIQDDLIKLTPLVFTNVSNTADALAKLSSQKYDLILSDTLREGNQDAGKEMMRVFQLRKISIPVVFCTLKHKISEYGQELLTLGAKEVLIKEDLPDFFKRFWPEKQFTTQGQGQPAEETKGQHQRSEAELQAAKAVCRIVLADGTIGTGFLTEGGYLFTCNYIIPTPEIAKTARVELGHELDDTGSPRPRIVYQLDPSDFVASDANGLDFTRVKIIDRSDAPLRPSDYVDFELSAIPAPGDTINIIHHPRGGYKQFAAGTVAGRQEQYLYYTVNTEPGSAGAPVFNQSWKVVALHHAHKTKNFGGTTGEFKEGEGVLGGRVMMFIQEIEKKPDGTIKKQVQAYIDKEDIESALYLLSEQTNFEELTAYVKQLIAQNESNRKLTYAGRMDLVDARNADAQMMNIALKLAEELDVLLSIDSELEQIKQLIAYNRTKDALTRLVRLNPEALTLQIRYIDAERQQLQEEFVDREWQMIKIQINSEVVEIVNKLQKPIVKDGQLGRKGALLHNIPKKMQAKDMYECRIRIALNKTILTKNWKNETMEIMKLDQITDFVSVEIGSIEMDAFEIIRVNNKAGQSVFPDTYSEWVFYIRPKQLGQYILNIYISSFIKPDKEKLLTDRVFSFDVEVTEKTQVK